MVDKKLSEFEGVGTTEVSSFPVLDKLTKNRVLAAERVMNFTNSITDTPQDIKLELVSGTLTLKSGSKVYIPNGSDVFDDFDISNDINYSYSLVSSTRMLFYNKTDNIMSSEILNNVFSGPDAPTGSGTIYWYDTTNNLVRQSTDGGLNWNDKVYSLPIGIIQVTSGSITSIKKVFNGLGYIGSALFSLPGIKGIYPNGRNSDGTLKSSSIATTKVLVLNDNSNKGPFHIMLSNGSINNYINVFYDVDRNILWNSGNPQISRLDCGVFKRLTGGIITEFNPKCVFRSTDYNEFLKTKSDLEQSISDVSSSVSTLDTNALHKSGTEYINGYKSFIDNVGLQSYSIEKGTTPSTNQVITFGFNDKNGVEYPNNRISQIQAKYNTDGESILTLQAYKSEVDSYLSGSIEIHYPKTGSPYATAPTPTSATDSSTKITTTQWIHDFLTTNNASAFSTWTKSSKGGFKLANGLVVNWGRATSGTITFAVPFSGNNSYSVSTAVGGDEQGATSWGQVNKLTSTGFKVVGASNSRTIYWLAIGY